METRDESRSGLIIGASRGIGLGLVRQLRARGWTLIATVRDRCTAVALAELSSTDGPPLTIEELDIADAASVVDFLAAIGDQTFDFALVNAGVLGPEHQSADRATSEELGDLFMTNAIAPIRIARRLYPRIATPDGSIGFMSSRMGSVADNTSGGLELYRASKAALNSLTRGLLAELGATASILTLHPGWVRTDMGGEDAPLDVETSTAGLAEVIEANLGKPGHHFLDYAGDTIPW
jgi:NAD(P)-dependent dehydrogenase (short-subunit alcohol dehydrogenase family)